MFMEIYDSHFKVHTWVNSIFLDPNTKLIRI